MTRLPVCALQPTSFSSAPAKRQASVKKAVKGEAKGKARAGGDHEPRTDFKDDEENSSQVGGRVSGLGILGFTNVTLEYVWAIAGGGILGSAGVCASIFFAFVETCGWH